jgi:heat shock protein HtpX
VSLYGEIASNKVKTYLLAALFFALVGLVVYFAAFLLSGATGFGLSVIAFLIAVAMSFFAYYESDKLVLALAGARPADERAEAFLINTVEGLAIAAGLPKPRVYVIDNDAINALATGRDPKHAVVAVTTGALKKLNRAELEGVIAHEMAHVKNYDIRLATIAAIMTGFVIMLADFIFRASFFGGRGQDREGGRGSAVFVIIGIALLVLSPIFAQLIKAAISRRREELADVSGVMLTRYPDGLLSALRKLARNEGEATKIEGASQAISHLYFANPLSGKMFSNLFSTHPPLEERIAVLEKYALEAKKAK